MRRAASCCCGACTIEVEGEPTLNAVCHCDNCRRRTGSALGWSVYFKDEQVLAKTGAAQLYEINNPANPQQRWFCGACGTTLYWKSAFMADHIGIAGGCFADPLPAPAFSQLDEQRFAWLALPEDWMRW